MRTSAEGIYAIGDLVPGPALAHKASDEGVIAVEDAAGLQTHPIEYIDIPRATFCTPNVGQLRPHRGAGARAGLRRRRRQGPVRRGRRRHRLRRPHRSGQDRRREEVRRAARRPHRRRQGDRADPGAGQRARARGRLSRGGADHPRPPDAVRGGDGSRPRRRRLADPRLTAESARVPAQPVFYYDLGDPAATWRPSGSCRARRWSPSGSRCWSAVGRAAAAEPDAAPDRARGRARAAAAALAADVAAGHGHGDARGDLRQAHRPGGRVLAGRLSPGFRRRTRPRRRAHGADRGGGVRDAPDGGAQGDRAALGAPRRSRRPTRARCKPAYGRCPRSRSASRCSTARLLAQAALPRSRAP